MVYPHQFVATGGLSFLLGVLMASRWTLSWSVIIVVLILLALLLILPAASIVKLLSVALIGLLLGWWRYDAVTALPDNLITDWADQTVAVVGVVASDPTFVGTNQRFHLRVETVDGQSATGKILLTVWPLPHYQYGDRLMMPVRLTLPEVFDDFDYPAYLARDGVFALGRASDDIQLLATPDWSIRRSLYQLRQWLASRTHQLVPYPNSALLNGVLLGLRSELSDDFKTALQNSGTTHIVALSGLHLTTVAGFFFWFLRRLKRKWALLGAGAGILLFVVMAGAPASVVRAAVMAWVMLIAALWGRKRDTANAILLAAVSMVAVNPLILQFNIGFQLSLTATAGIIYLAPAFLHWFRWWPIILQTAAATTASATLSTLPLIAFHFGGLSLVALATNILVVPLVPFLMLFGFITMLLAAILPDWQWLGLPAVWLSGMVMGIINWFGRLPLAYLPVPPLSPLIPVVYYLGMVLIINRLRRDKQMVV